MDFFFGVIPPEAIAHRLREQFRYGTEPHITVKAQSGLKDETFDAWREAARTAVAGFGPLDVTLGKLGTFGDRVAYVSVDSPRIHDLHRLLVEAVAPTRDEMLRYHEMGPFTPHLSVGKRGRFDLRDVRARVERLGQLPPFVVESVWLFRQDVAGMPYKRLEEMPLV